MLKLEDLNNDKNFRRPLEDIGLGSEDFTVYEGFRLDLWEYVYYIIDNENTLIAETDSMEKADGIAQGCQAYKDYLQRRISDGQAV